MAVFSWDSRLFRKQPDVCNHSRVIKAPEYNDPFDGMIYYRDRCVDCNEMLSEETRKENVADVIWLATSKTVRGGLPLSSAIALAQQGNFERGKNSYGVRVTKRWKNDELEEVDEYYPMFG